MAVVIALLLGTFVWSRQAGFHPFSPAAGVPAMWRDKIDEALADTLSDFQRKALSDYKITDAEYKQAQDLFGQCMAGFGWKVDWAERNDIYQSSNLPGTTRNGGFRNSDDLQCARTTIWYIVQLYWDMKYNPDGLTNEQLIRACFDRHDVPYDHTMTDDQFASMVDDPGYQPPNDAAAVCMVDPTGRQGTTPGEAYSNLESRKMGVPINFNGPQSLPDSMFTGRQTLTITPGPTPQQVEITIPAGPPDMSFIGGDYAVCVTVITDPTTTSTILWNVGAAGVTPSNWQVSLVTLATPEAPDADRTSYMIMSDNNGNTDAMRMIVTPDNTTGKWVLKIELAWTW